MLKEGAVMQTKRKAYETRTDADIKRAFLGLLARKPLADITITELAREANVSRSTFYAHYSNLSDVYESLVAELESTMAPLLPQVNCLPGHECAHDQLFCTLVRESKRYQPIINEDRFLPTFLADTDGSESHDIYVLLIEAGYTPAQARALCKFQLSGCFSAARTSRESREEWESIRSVIDTFIQGGINACLEAKK